MEFNQTRGQLYFFIVVRRMSSSVQVQTVKTKYKLLLSLRAIWITVVYGHVSPIRVLSPLEE